MITEEKVLLPEERIFDYRFTKGRQEQATGTTGTVSVALVNNIASRKAPDLPSLFIDEEDEQRREARLLQLKQLQEIDEKKLIDRDNKPVYLNYMDVKTTLALSHVLTQFKDEEEIRNYELMLRRGEEPRTRITIPVDVTSFTKFLSSDGKARARQKKDVLDELQRLSEIRQVQEYGKGEDRVRFIAPLIQIQEQLIDLSPDKRLNLDIVNIQFGRLFFYKLYNEYATVKPELFQMWGRLPGTKSELFSVLLADLLAKYTGHRIAALRAEKGIKRTSYKTEESYFAARNKKRKDALTYSEYTDTLKQRVTTDYTSTREQQRRFIKDLRQAIAALITYGIITEATTIKESTKGSRVDFVFNLDYGKQQENILEDFLSETQEGDEE